MGVEVFGNPIIFHEALRDEFMAAMKLIIGQFTLACTAHYATMAVLPVFLLENKTIDSSVVGAIFLTASVTGKFARIFLSGIIDRFMAGNVLSMSCLCSAIVLLCLPEINSSALIAAFLFIFNLSNGANSISVRAMIASYGAKKGSTASHFTKLSIGSSIASLSGPPLSFFVLHAMGSITPFHVFSVMLIFTSLIIFTKRKTLPEIAKQANIISGIKSASQTPGFLNLMIFVLLFYFCNSLLYTSITVYAVFHLNLLAWGGILLAISAITLILFSLPVNRLCDRCKLSDYGRIRTGAALYFIAFLFIILGQNIYWLSIAMIFWGLGEGIMDPTMTKKVTSLVPAEFYIASLTIQSIIVGLGEGIGSFLGIPAAASASNSGMTGFIVAAIISVFMFLLSLRVMQEKRKVMQETISKQAD